MAAMEAENLSLQIRDYRKRGDSKGGKGGEMEVMVINVESSHIADSR